MAANLWPHVRAMVGAAYDRTDLGLLADLDTDVLSGSALLWVVEKDGSIACAAVTRIERTQASKVCTVLACGGKRFGDWKHLLSGVEEYAGQSGCDAVRWFGRKGWSRIYPEYREIGAIYERKLNGRDGNA